MPETGKQREVGDAECKEDRSHLSEWWARLKRLEHRLVEPSLENGALRITLLGEEPPCST